MGDIYTKVRKELSAFADMEEDLRQLSIHNSTTDVATPYLKIQLLKSTALANAVRTCLEEGFAPLDIHKNIGTVIREVLDENQKKTGHRKLVFGLRF